MGTKAQVAQRPFLGLRRFDVIALGAMVVVSIAISACAPKANKKASEEEVVTECSLATGQEYTLQGQWSAPPIKISFRSGDWSSEEITAVQAGGETWNTFFSKSKGFTIFNLGGTGAGNLSGLNQNSPNCASTTTLADGTVIYKRASSWTKSTSAIAVTTTCFSTNTTPTGGSLATIFNSIIEINYQNFFNVSAGRYPDLQSIALHELGHLMGLDHSCGPLGKPNQSKPYMNCPDVTADPSNEMIGTVMYPQVFFNGTAGEEKRTLTSNDQSRANCLYK